MESQTSVGTGNNVYLYCFFRGPSSLSPQEGIDEANPTLILSCNDLCALVSPVPASDYNQEALAQRLQDLEWLTPRVKRHDLIIRYAMAHHPVIPVRFGTIYVNAERVLGILRSRYDELCCHLDFISAKEEWGVKVYAEKGAGRKIEVSSELIDQLDRKISSTKSPGQAYLLTKKRESLIRQQSAESLRATSDKLYQQMLPWSVDGRRSKALSRNATGKESDMILNAAFLLHKLDVEDFKGKVDALAADYEDYDLSFEISGPWPCYNFCPDLSARLAEQIE